MSVSANNRAGSPAAAHGLEPRLAGLHDAVLEQLLEVATYGGRGQVEALRESRRRGRSVDQDRPGDTFAGRPVRGRLRVLVHFHNTSVTLMPEHIQPRLP